jgi:hypothetical protein
MEEVVKVRRIIIDWNRIGLYNLPGIIIDCNRLGLSTTLGLEHQNCAQTKFIRNRHKYADRHNPIAHVNRLKFGVFRVCWGGNGLGKALQLGLAKASRRG